MTKLTMAVVLSAAVILGGIGVAASADAASNGTCDQTQDRTMLKLKDGSCEQAEDQTQLKTRLQEQTQLQLRDGSCNCSQCQEYLYSWNYDYEWSYAGNHSQSNQWNYSWSHAVGDSA